MRQRKYSPEKIIRELKEAEVLSGTPRVRMAANRERAAGRAERYSSSCLLASDQPENSTRRFIMNLDL